MPANVKSMRKVKEVLRLRFELGLGQRQIARSCGMGLGTVHEYLERAVAAGIGWPLPEGLGEEELEAKLFGNQPVQAGAVRPRSQPDWNTIHQQLQQHRHLTLQLVWEEYRHANPEGYRYSWFCANAINTGGDTWMWCCVRNTKPGKRCSWTGRGQLSPCMTPRRGKPGPASLFVSVLGASSPPYAEATRDQQLEAWIQAHIHALEFFGGVPILVVPDNTKTAVTRACRYDPDLNPTYQEFAVHYGMEVVPARPYKPRDKAKAESGVQVCERWIVAALGNRKFFSLPELNQAIRELLVRLSERPFRKRDGSRSSLFQSLEKPALAALPAERFDMSQWSRATVNIDYPPPSMGTFTVCRTLWCNKSWKSAPRRLRWRFSTRATGLLPTCAVAGAAKPSPRMSTAPRVIKPIWNGRHRGWCTGHAALVPTRPSCLSES